MGSIGLETAFRTTKGRDEARRQTRQRRAAGLAQPLERSREGATSEVEGKPLRVSCPCWQEKTVSRKLHSPVSIPRVIWDTRRPWHPPLLTNHPPPCPHMRVLPHPPAAAGPAWPGVPGPCCLAAASAVGLCHGDGGSCRRWVFVTICQKAPLSPRPTLREHFCPMALETGPM